MLSVVIVPTWFVVASTERTLSSCKNCCKVMTDLVLIRTSEFQIWKRNSRLVLILQIVCVQGQTVLVWIWSAAGCITNKPIQWITTEKRNHKIEFFPIGRNSVDLNNCFQCLCCVYNRTESYGITALNISQGAMDRANEALIPFLNKMLKSFNLL